MTLVNKSQLAEIVGKTPQTLTTWQKNGLPIYAEGRNGQSHQYETVDVIQWMINDKIGKLTVGGDGTVHDYEAERARLTHHQANKTALEESVLQGKLIPADVVEQVQGDMVSSARARLLSIPTKAAHAMLGLDDLSTAQDVLKQYVYEALNELADYRPEQYGIESAEQNIENVDTATRTNN